MNFKNTARRLEPNCANKNLLSVVKNDVDYDDANQTYIANMR